MWRFNRPVISPRVLGRVLSPPPPSLKKKHPLRRHQLPLTQIKSGPFYRTASCLQGWHRWWRWGQRLGKPWQTCCKCFWNRNCRTEKRVEAGGRGTINGELQCQALPGQQPWDRPRSVCQSHAKAICSVLSSKIPRTQRQGVDDVKLVKLFFSPEAPLMSVEVAAPLAADFQQ